MFSSLLGCCGSLFLQVLQVERVRSFNGHSKCTGPNLSGHNTERAGHAEQNCVVVVLGETVVHEESAGTAVNVWPRVLDFASCREKVWNSLEVCLDKVYQVVVLDVFFSELKFEHETRIRLAQDSVAVTGNNFAGFERVSNVLLDVFFSPVLTELFLEVKNKAKALLVGKSM